MLIMRRCLTCLFAAFLMTVGGVVSRTISDISNECRQLKSSYVCDPEELLTVDEGKLFKMSVCDHEFVIVLC